MKVERISTDVLIVGGGTAGCYAALTIAEKSDKKVLICEKANIKRSGCLAAGVNALNAYIAGERKPEDYVERVTKDAEQIVRHDLLLTMSERLNSTAEKLEQLGLVILKDENGKYIKYTCHNADKTYELWPVSINDDKARCVVFDFRYLYSPIEVDILNPLKYEAWFRAKPKLFSDILQKFSSHASRLGISSINLT